MGILLGLLAALGWGVADFLVSQTSRRVGTTQTLFYIQLVGFVAIVAVLAARFGVPVATPAIWAATFGLALINLAGTALIYRAYAIGTLALVSPIASGFAVVTALLALLSGARLTLLALVGALLLIVGVAVVSQGADDGHAPAQIVRPRRRLPPGVIEAIGVAFGFGVYFWGLGFVSPQLGPIWPIVISRAVSALGVTLWLAHAKVLPMRLPGAVWLLVCGTAAMDTVAFLAFNIGIGSTETAIVTALAALFSAFTVLLAWALLRERLAPHQWAGVGVILAGVLLVSV